jgi:hypothetical protein
MGGFQCQSVSAATLARHVSGANQADDCELLMGTSRCPSTGRTPLGRQRTFRRSPDNMLQAKKNRKSFACTGKDLVGVVCNTLAYDENEN